MWSLFLTFVNLVITPLAATVRLQVFQCTLLHRYQGAGLYELAEQVFFPVQVFGCRVQNKILSSLFLILSSFVLLRVYGISYYSRSQKHFETQSFCVNLFFKATNNLMCLDRSAPLSSSNLFVCLWRSFSIFLSA